MTEMSGAQMEEGLNEREIRNSSLSSETLSVIGSAVMDTDLQMQSAKFYNSPFLIWNLPFI